MLIHGGGATWRMWDTVIPLLEERHDVLAATLPGHWGGPAVPEHGDFGIYALADAAEREMSAAGFETAHVVGSSLGAWVALELAKRGRATTLVAISPAGGWRIHSLEWRFVRRMYLSMQPLSRLMARDAERWSRRPRLRRFLYWHHFAHPESLSPAQCSHLLRSVAHCSGMRAFIDWGDKHGGVQALDQIRCPTLFAFPEKDRVLPRGRYGEPLLRALPSASAIALPDVGHAPMYDDPDLVAQMILQFARRSPNEAAV